MSSDKHGIQHKLTEWLRQQRPQADNLLVSDFSAPDAGASNETLLFDISWEQDGKQHSQALVARLQPTAAGVFPEYELDKQYRAMESLAGTGIAVPALAGFEADAGVLGTPFYLMERIEGKVIQENPPYYMDGWFTRLEPQERRELWFNAITAGAQVNKQDWQALGFAWLDQPELGDTPLKQQLAYYQRFLGWVESRGRPYPKLRACYDWLVREQPSEEAVALCWGDCKAANLMVKGTEVVGVLDWEMVRLGNPVDDLAWWFTLDNSMSEGLERLVGMEVPKLEGIPSRDEMIRHWEAQSGFSAEHIDYYEMLGAFKFGIIMASIGLKYTHDGLVPEEMEMDLNNTCTPLLDRLMATNGITV